MTNEEYMTKIAHNAIYLNTLKKTVTAFSFPIVDHFSNTNLATNYIMHNKPTQIDGV